MEPAIVTTPFIFDPENNGDIFVRYLCPNLNLQDLKRVSGLSKFCFSMIHEYFTSISPHEKTKLILSEGRLSALPRSNTTDRYLLCFTNQSAVTNKEIFIYYTKKGEQVPVLTAHIECINTETMKTNKKTITLNFKIASCVEKLIPSENAFYMLCRKTDHKNVLEGKNIVIYSSTKKVKPVSIPVSMTSNILEVNADEFFVNIDSNVLGIYNKATATQINTLKFDQKIVGVKTCEKYLYVRLVDGSIHIHDTKANKLINLIKGPDCTISYDHFEILGNYLFTAEKNSSITKWEFKMDGMIEKKAEMKIDSGEFNFQIDDKILYINLPGYPIRAFDCETFPHYLGSLKTPSKTKKYSQYVNEKILFTIVEDKKISCFAFNLNPEFKSYVVEKKESSEPNKKVNKAPKKSVKPKEESQVVVKSVVEKKESLEPKKKDKKAPQKSVKPKKEESQVAVKSVEPKQDENEIFQDSIPKKKDKEEKDHENCIIC